MSVDGLEQLHGSITFLFFLSMRLEARFTKKNSQMWVDEHQAAAGNDGGEALRPVVMHQRLARAG